MPHSNELTDVTIGHRALTTTFAPCFHIAAMRSADAHTQESAETPVTVSAPVPQHVHVETPHRIGNEAVPLTSDTE